VYTHTNGDATPDQTNDYTYSYDAVGNVVAVYNANSTNRGNEVYFFSQDTFGNELSSDTGASLFGGAEWDVARSTGITEHQTGKSIDPFTGLYFFAARWYDSGVGRFVGRDPVRQVGGAVYAISHNNPTNSSDPTGKCLGCSVSEGGSTGVTPPNAWSILAYGKTCDEGSARAEFDSIKETCSNKCWNLGIFWCGTKATDQCNCIKDCVAQMGLAQTAVN
jgi:RHS repeat-associated protein